MSSVENLQTSLSESESVADQQRSVVVSIQEQDKSKKEAIKRKIFSERALRGLEIVILTLVVLCVVGLLCIPLVLYFAEKVNVIDVLLKQL